MHRVELKDPLTCNRHCPHPVPNAPCGVERSTEGREVSKPGTVPNAPCGVERLFCPLPLPALPGVPNAPCGVESNKENLFITSIAMFLMHRVELKDILNTLTTPLLFVPNAPCGVERKILYGPGQIRHQFLMHRVELKAQQGYNLPHQERSS